MAEFPLAAQCKQLTLEFSNNPLAAYFLNPITDKKLLAEYKEKIERPMELSTIKKRLKDGYYTTMREWADDMYLVFSNAIKYNGDESPVGGAARYLKKKLDKQMMKLEATNLRNYENQLIQLGHQLEELLRKPPPAFNVVCNYEMRTDKDKNFTIERIMRLKEQLEAMVQGGKEAEITAVVMKTEPEMKGLELDMGRLSRRTLLALEELVKQNA